VLAAFRCRRPRTGAHHRSAQRRAGGGRAGRRQRDRGRCDARRRLVDRADGDGRRGRHRIRAGARSRGPAAARRRRRARAHDPGVRRLPAAMSATTSSRWRAAFGNAAMLALLLVAALALLPWHDDPWWPASPRPRQWWLAAGALVLYLAACGALLLRRRGHVGTDTGAPLPWLVAHASQTGFAAELADHTAASLRAAGCEVALHPLSAVDATMLARTRRALLIASTTGEGDPPDPALTFLRETMAREPALAHLQYAVLALGDRDYAHFCGFGHRLDQWLRDCGASPLFDLTEVDNGDPGALRHWQHHLAQAAGAAA